MDYSARLRGLKTSPIRKLLPFSIEAKAKGKKIYHLNIGQPDIKTPKSFFTAIANAKQEVLAYSNSQGDPDLIEATIDYYKTYNMEFDKDEILITNGGSEALLFSLIATCDPGDNVVIPEPFYSSYTGFGSIVNVEVSPITTKAENGFRLPSKEDMAKSINEKTKAIVISNPGNPTGVIYTKEEIKHLAELAVEHDLFIISDEVYREFVYDGDYSNFNGLEEVKDRVIIVDSISKRYSACGARIGSVASKNKELMALMLKLCQGRLCAPTLEQIGATELYKTPSSYFEEVNAEYKKRRDVLYKGLKEIDGVICHKPAGAFYTIAKLPVESAEDFVIFMLKEFELDGETVMMAPAEGFYSTPGMGKDEVRLAYVLNEEDLKKAMKILKAGLEKYKSIEREQLKCFLPTSKTPKKI